MITHFLVNWKAYIHSLSSLTFAGISIAALTQIIGLLGAIVGLAGGCLSLYFTIRKERREAAKRQ